jgi:hypothetical protein
MKIKLKLDELKIQSFITELKPQVAHTAKGGDSDVSAGGSGCSTQHTVCMTCLLPDPWMMTKLMNPPINPGSPPPIVITPDPPTVPPTLPPHTVGG